ncbi:MAG: hypothetical protein ACP5SH_24060 [Syntrophobacteraceae bacterium]
MKRAILTLAMVLALVGFAGLTGSMAATLHTWDTHFCTPGYTNYIGAPGSCPTMAGVRADTPSLMGNIGF